MPTGVFNGGIDVTEWVLYLFFAFFAGLILYLRREDRREGYPLEDDLSGRLESTGGLLFIAQPKRFILPHGGGEALAPNAARDMRDVKAIRTAPWAGSPLEPTGDPMQAGVGPGAYAERARKPDLTTHGTPRLAPLRVDASFFFDIPGADPRGMAVLGADNAEAGVVSDVWVDRSEYLIRYLEVELTESRRRVLLPMPMAIIQRSRRRVKVSAILAEQFSGVPALTDPNQITRDEEERIGAYYGAGLLYATPSRAEPYL